MSSQPQEEAPYFVRDLSRAEWQRGIGAVIFRVVGDTLFQEGDIDTPDMYVINEMAEHQHFSSNIDPFWYRAHAAIRAMLTERVYQAREALPVETHEGFSLFTYYGSHQKGDPYTVIEEGVDAQVHFPLNLVQIISFRAQQDRIDALKVRNYEEVVGVLLRPDVREMIDQALLTSNGYWRSVSANKGMPRLFRKYSKNSGPMGSAYEIANNIEFDKAGTVRWSDDILRSLRDNMRRVNQAGVSSTGVDVGSRTSSGCPARHLQPSAEALECYESVLEKIIAVTGKNRQELLAKRTKSVVDDGLDFIVEILRDFKAYSSGKKTTYLNSARYQESADQQSAARA